MASENFQRFYKSFFGDPHEAWHDGLDLEALRQLEGEELLEAERRLLAALKSRDTRAVEGMGVIRSQKAAAPLKAMLASAKDSLLVKVALALWQIEEFPEAVHYIVKVLKQPPSWKRGTVAMEAVIALKHVHTQEAVQALTEALNDEEMLVRHHAVNSLLTIYGMEPDYRNSHPLAIKMMVKEPEKRQTAIVELMELLSQ